MKPLSLLMLLLLMPVLSLSSPAKQQFAAVTKPPGQFLLVTLDNGAMFRTYIDCRGARTPAVLIDVGLGDASANWLGIANSLAEKNIKACIYDRAGYGYSDVGPGKRTSKQISKELHSIAQQAKIPGPYIIVGHSFGGFTAMQFAKMFPKDTAGIVLVDSSHPAQVERLARLDKIKTTRLLIKQEGALPDNASDIEKKWFLLNSSRKAVFTQMDELRYFSDSAKEVAEIKHIKNIPAAIITRGQEQLPEIEGVSMEEEWQDMQRDLLNTIENSWQVIAVSSGHMIYKEDPEIVVDNILKVHAMSSKQSMNQITAPAD